MKGGCKDRPRLFQWCTVAGQEPEEQTKTQEVPWNIRKDFFHCRCDWAQKGCGISALGDIQKPAEHDSGQLALGGWDGAGGLDHLTSRAQFQPQSFCSSVILQLVDNIKVVLNILIQQQASFQGPC